MKSNSNKITDKAEMVLTSTGIALTAAGSINPFAGLAGAVVSITALPFAAYNSSLIRKQLNTIIDEFNKLETRLDRLENLNEEQISHFLLNEYKIFDYCLKEKMRDKIQAYAKIFSSGINNCNVFEENDLFDIQIDIINSLRIEDIVLINQIFGFIEKEGLMPYACEFTKEELNSFIISSTDEKDVLNEYALRHLVNLGLISEKLSGSLPNVVGEEMTMSDEILFRYSLTQRCKMIRDIIVSLN